MNLWWNNRQVEAFSALLRACYYWKDIVALLPLIDSMNESFNDAGLNDTKATCTVEISPSSMDTRTVTFFAFLGDGYYIDNNDESYADRFIKWTIEYQGLTQTQKSWDS